MREVGADIESIPGSASGEFDSPENFFCPHVKQPWCHLNSSRTETVDPCPYQRKNQRDRMSYEEYSLF